MFRRVFTEYVYVKESVRLGECSLNIYMLRRVYVYMFRRVFTEYVYFKESVRVYV